MKPFDSEGLIEPGLHHYTYDDFVKQFVRGFPASNQREELHTLAFLWLAELKRQITAKEIWFNGEFISSQENPTVMELCVFLDPSCLTGKSAGLCIELQKIAPDYKCNAYFGLFERLNGPFYWTEQFGFNSTHIPQGIVVLSWNEILIALS